MAPPLDLRFLDSPLVRHVTCARCRCVVHENEQVAHVAWHVAVEGRIVRSARYASGKVIGQDPQE